MKLKHDLDLIDDIRAAHGYPSLPKLRLLVKGMSDDNPGKPAERSISKWVYHRQCEELPDDQSRQNPVLDPRPGVLPGTNITIKALGDWMTLAKNGEKQAFEIVCMNSGIRAILPTRDRTCATLINELKLWVAHAGRCPDSITLIGLQDVEGLCKPME